MANDEQGNEQNAHLVLVKGGGPRRREKRGRAPSAKPAPQEQELQLIDCRPNLYERLAGAGPGPASKRFVRAVEDVIRFISSRLRREKRESNDN